jgi:hypothetical protein
MERDLLDAQETLRRVVLGADRVLASLEGRARIGRRVKAAARRRAQASLDLFAPGAPAAA